MVNISHGHALASARRTGSGEASRDYRRVDERHDGL